MPENRKLVVTVGGANGERVIRMSPSSFQLGKKHTMAPLPIMAGGSSVNHSCRLLASGIGAFPVLPIVDDVVGQVTVGALKSSAGVGASDFEMEDFYMEGEGLATPFTTILSVDSQRTILNEFSDKLVKAFPEHCERRLDALQRSQAHGVSDSQKPHGVMIGHVHADRRDPPGQVGGISQSIIRRFSTKDIKVFANFGSSQYRLGTHRWAHLLDKLHCFQLDIDEIREFCRDAGPETLEDILEWFKDRCTVVITMERMGAVARLKGSESVVLAWPYDLKPGEMKDSTGAGDAFAAGVVASALVTPLDSDDALSRAMEHGRLWGAYACLNVGGANNCPTCEQLDAFKNDHRLFLETERRTLENAKPTLRILDRIFLR